MHPRLRRLLTLALLGTTGIALPTGLAWIAGGGSAAIVVASLLSGGALVGLALWLSWRALRLFLFSVGRKLAFSYFLIGILPVPMLGALLALNAYLLGGYLIGHIYRDAFAELELSLQAAATAELAGPAGRAEWPVAGSQVAVARYVDGRRVGDDGRFPAEWPAWLAEEHRIGDYVSLPDGTPTVAALAGAAPEGAVAIYTGDVERTLSARSEVWLQLLKPEDPRRDAPLRLQLGDREFALLPLVARRSVEGRDLFFGDRASRGLAGRPLLWWGEITGPVRALADGSELLEFVTVSLNSSPRVATRGLFSTSVELDTAVWALVISVTALLGSIYAIAVVMALWMIFTVSRAVNRLSRATGAVQRGDFSARIPVRRRDQLGELQRSFNEMTENLQMLVETRAQKEILEKELEIARGLQESLLPRDLPHTEELEFATLFEPSAAIGGDYYDILPAADGRLAVVIADVAGHGLPAGLRMAMLKAALSTLIEEGRPPEQIVKRLDAMIGRSGERRFLVTATLASIDLSRATIELTNAGHPPTYLLRGGEAREILLPGNPLGALAANYGRATLSLERDDVVVWLSDGLIEATDAHGEPFGYERLRASLAGPPAAASKVLQRLVAAVTGHAGSAPADDDRTVVAMRYRGDAGAPGSGTPRPA
ncbi:MAG: SpoIIE family protein phosphatase [Thermoanaerobaculia bacterium]|nr:SpoIIE family protein phosphatase [Thermoanaerobaculia bacterium]